MRILRSVPLGCVVMFCLGCAEERALEPPPVTKLPAMSVLDDPIVAISAAVEARDTSRGRYEYGDLSIKIPNSVVSHFAPVDDIHLTYYCPDDCHPCTVAVLNHASSAWEGIEAYPAGGACLGMSLIMARLLSGIGVGPVSEYLGAENTIRLRGHMRAAVVELVEYRDDYRTVRLSREFYPPDAMTWDGEKLWMAISYWDTDSTWGDSLLFLDAEGERLSQVWLPQGDIHSLAWTGEHMWATQGGNPIVFTMMREDGMSLRAFSMTGLRNHISGGMTWADGYLWTCLNGTELIAINPSASIESRLPVIDRRFPMPSAVKSIAFDGAHLLTLTSEIRSYSLEGVLQNTFPMPVTYASVMAWDGQALWMVHNGPREPFWIMTYTTLLSRFTIP